MPPADLRVLFLSDTHLGLTAGTRTGASRRNDVHFDAFHRALAPAFRREVDLVVHGGDMFYRSRVRPGLVLRAFDPLKRLADIGIPVVIVPGNHERSAIPFPLLAAHPGIHIFDRPRTFTLNVRGISVAIAGFPNDRDQIARTFAVLLERTEWNAHPTDIRLLLIHQTVEGATVGPVDYVFRRGPDVIPGRSIPAGFAAVLSGHIHRQQVLITDLRGRMLASPVFYPGSTARTSSAERLEDKVFVILEIAPDAPAGGRMVAMELHELSPAGAFIPAMREVDRVQIRN